MTSLTDNLEPSRAPQPSNPPRSFSPAIVAIALLLGVGGVGWAGFSIYQATRPAERPRSASDVVREEGRRAPRPDALAAAPSETAPQPGERRIVQGAPGDDLSGRAMPVPPKDPNYTLIANADDANKAVAAIGASFGEQAAKIEGLTNTPIQTGDQLAEATRNFLAPLVAGDMADQSGYLIKNGAKPTDSPQLKRMLENVAKVLQFCDLDVGKARAQKAPKVVGPAAGVLKSLPPGAAAFMMNQMDGDQGSVSTLTMPLSGFLPEAGKEVPDDAPRVEFLVPARLKDPAFKDKGFQLGIIMAKGPGSRWVPQSLSFHTTDMDTVKALQKTIAPPRNPNANTGAPKPVDPSSGK
ncbi:MAG: hypothetical protein K2Y21_06210 [Phycisphaerales bacterium]|nr:hypothetical protein [Phycisphaerales bacterium]